ncbi:MAG: extracellular solute-binding protein [Eubacterium sp.]|nr:extracellular solute-binding protein [Eubacterium sp.]
MVIRRCMKCMKEFSIPEGHENENFCCPHCGFVEGTPPKESNHLYPGMVLQNRYQIGIVVGFGGFGITYKAWDRELGIAVAIKEYYPSGVVMREPGKKEVIVYEGNRKEEFYIGLERFLEEARRTAQFEHSKHIVQVKNFFRENNTAYLVMEFLDGASVKDYLKMNKKMPVKDAVAVTDSVLDALKEMHAAGILHRDIGPGNIFLCGRNVKIIDFGAARLSDGDKEVTRSVIVTPGFAPAEQYQSKSKQGPWTDLYAVAATLYNMVTGKRPDESTDRMMDDQVEDPDKLNPEVSHELSNTIMKGMAVNPNLRFRSVDEFSDALHEKKKVENPKQELKRRKKRRIISIAAVIAVLLFAAGVAITLFMDNYHRTHLREAELSIWIPYDSALYTEEQAKTHYEESVFAAFTSDVNNSKVTLSIVYIPENEYSAKLRDAVEKGNLPAVFMMDELDTEILKYTESLKSVFGDDVLEATDDFYYLDTYKSLYGDPQALPTGINVPIVYGNRSGNKQSTLDVDGVNVTGLASLKDNGSAGYYVSGRVYSEFVNSLGGSYTYDGKLRLDDTAKQTVEEFRNSSVALTYNASDAGNNVSGEGAYIDGLALAAFDGNQIDFYVGDITDLRVLNQDDKGLVGRYVPKAIQQDKIYADFCAYWCISDAAASKSRPVKYAAERFLVYLMISDSQKAHFHNDYKSALPIRKDAYSDIDAQLKFIETEYMGKLQFLKEDRAAETAASVQLQKDAVIEKKKTVQECLGE